VKDILQNVALFFLLCFPFHLCGLQSQINDPQIKWVDRFIIQEMQKKAIPGLAIALYYNNQSTIRCYGVANKTNRNPVSPNTIFEIASLTKVFTTTELALQVERGFVKLDDPITNYLPALRQSQGGIRQVTLLQLATHTSRLPREIPGPKGQRLDIPTILTYLNIWRPFNRGPHLYLYSNLGFKILGLTLSTRAHTTYENLIATDILKPLGMTSTMIEIPPQLQSYAAQGYNPQDQPTHNLNSVLTGSGAIKSTIKDLLIFLQANLGLGAPRELTEAFSIAQQGYYKVNDQLTMGLAWQRLHKWGIFIIDKDGSLPGFSSYIGMLPEQKIGVVILANKSKILITQMGRTVLRHLAQTENYSQYQK
jgi:beta-lactamase class C